MFLPSHTVSGLEACDLSCFVLDSTVAHVGLQPKDNFMLPSFSLLQFKITGLQQMTLGTPRTKVMEPFPQVLLTRVGNTSR